MGAPVKAKRYAPSFDEAIYIIRTRAELAMFIQMIGAMTIAKALAFIIRPYEHQRTIAQNACLHGWCRHISKRWMESTGELWSPKAWKEFFKKVHLGEEEMRIGIQSVSVTRRSRDLTVAEFRELLDFIDHFAGAELEIFDLPRGPTYHEAMRP